MKESKNKRIEIYEAIKHNDIMQVKSILDKCIAVDHELITNYACRLGNVDIVKFLIKEGCNVKKTTTISAMLPIHYACYSGNLKLVKLLIRKGSSIKVMAKNGELPFHYACASGNLKLVKFLNNKNSYFKYMSDHDRKKSIHYASKSGNLELIKFLIKKGSNPHAVDGNRENPLHYACRSRNLEVVKYLIKEHNADYNWNNRFGISPLDIAYENKSRDIIEFILEYNNLCNKTSFRNACIENNRAVVKSVLKYGKFSNIEPDARDKVINILISKDGDEMIITKAVRKR